MHPVDYVLIVVMCLASVGIGIFTSCTGGKQKSTSEYMMGDRQMHLLPVAVSILVSFWSAISLLGAPAEIFYFGSYYNVTVIGISLACFISAFCFVPLFYPLKIISIFEYLELRYQTKIIRYWSTVLYVLTSILYLSVAQLAPAVALEAVMGIPEWGGILIIGGISVIYTSLGGIKAVVWSDVFQSVFIVVGLTSAAIKATVDSGGLGAVVNTNTAWGRFDTFDWSLDPRVRLTFWSSAFGTMLTWIPCYGPNQAAFQRFASLPTLAKAKSSILLNIVGVLFFFFLLSLTGYALFAFYTLRGCDPFSNAEVKSINQLFPHYIGKELNIPSLPGIIMACILSGAFSTTSTLLNSQASVTVIDFVQPHWQLADEKATFVTKWLVVGYGLLGSILALASANIRGVPLMQISGSFISASTGATLGVFLLASCVPKSTWKGALVGSVASLALVGWICCGSFSLADGPKMLPLEISNCTQRNITETAIMENTSNSAQQPLLSGITETTIMVNTNNSTQQQFLSGISGLYSISFQWYGLLGSASCFLIGLLISVPNIMDSDATVPDVKFILPGLRRFLGRRQEKIYKQVPLEQKEASPKVHRLGQLSQHPDETTEM